MTAWLLLSGSLVSMQVAGKAAHTLGEEYYKLRKNKSRVFLGPFERCLDNVVWLCPEDFMITVYIIK